MDASSIIECGGFYFIHNFDSGNLGHVERIPTELIVPSLNAKTNTMETPDYEFNLWTRPDCAGTEFENGNRTWFYFGVQPSERNVLVRLNLINLNKQGKMYSQGMAPVTRTLPGKPHWERIKDRPIHSTDDNTFTLSFKYRTADNVKATTFFAFTYPFSFAELQLALNSIDLKMLPLPPAQTPDDIYYCRECLIHSLEGRRVDLLTITSYHGITEEREERLKNLFPENQPRPHKFLNKKIIFVSARVHPGETPSSFVFNGFLNLLLTKADPIAIQLRRLYVFKMIPFLNPDGVARGHYRTDTRGVNLNRVYLNPSLTLHPTVFAARSLIRYYHYGCEKEDTFDDSKSLTSRSIQNISEASEINEPKQEAKKKKSPTGPLYNKGVEVYKRPEKEKVGKVKSTTTIKLPSSTSDSIKKDKRTKQAAETANLTKQVCDMKLQEMSSQTGSTSSKSETNVNENATNSCLLDEVTLRNCLGSNVHISTSEELNLQGPNPLRPLRDTLKNSISLLMESSPQQGSVKEAQQTSLKMGWCAQCKQSIFSLDDARIMEPNTIQPLNANSATSNADSPCEYTSINEYREVQKKKFEEQEISEQSSEHELKDIVYFCTNCFKRYMITPSKEEIKLDLTVSTASVGVSVGDGGDVHADHDSTELIAGSTGDVLVTPKSPPPKQKPKSAPLREKTKKKFPTSNSVQKCQNVLKEPESGLYLYIDLHGHASKKGIFMYGNYFDDLESCVECMLLPRIMSLNNLHFHFSSCNFTEKNMYLKDRRDGMSREGSGRVAVFKATGLVRSYTLECNYNTGRLVNVLPPTLRDGTGAAPPAASQVPPKYTPHIFEEVGRSLGASILDLTGQHPNSRIPCSEHCNLSAVREWLRAHTRTMRPQLMSRIRAKTSSSPPRVPPYARAKAKVTEERKENTYVGSKHDVKRTPPILTPNSGHEIINLKYSKKNEPVKTSSRTKYLSENEPKPKTLSTKRRNILAIRKPNSSKTTVGGVIKAKVSRRSIDDAENPRPCLLKPKLSKRSFTRTLRSSVTRANRCRAMASSSSEDMPAGAWEEMGSEYIHHENLGGKRRTLPTPSPARLKKIRLKTGM